MPIEYRPERLSAAGFVEFHAVADNDTPEGRALNRRVDIVVLAAPRKPPARGFPGLGNESASAAPTNISLDTTH